jgi:hypothetical protein
MKTFKEHLLEETKKNIPEIFVHYRSGKDEKHNPHHKPKKGDTDKPAEFFAHYRSGKDEKHNPESIKENFQWRHDDKSLKEASNNLHSLDHHEDLTLQEGDKFGGDHEDNLRVYTAESRPINNALLKKKKLKGMAASIVKSMDRATRNPKNKLKKPIKTYSGVGEQFADVLSNTKPGGLVKSSAYISSSIDHEVARNFSEDVIDKKDSSHIRKHFIQFHLPKGYSKARYIPDGLHYHGGEHEVVLARGQKFRKIKTTNLPVSAPTSDDSKVRYTAVVHHLEPVD